MLRRFSVNFAIFSMLFDAAVIVGNLAFTAFLRPLLNNLPFAVPIPIRVEWPPAVYILFPLAWVGIFVVFSVYDGRRHLRVVDEFASVTLGSLLAGISLAGLLYLSYRETSRVLFLSFVLLTYLTFLFWRVIFRIFHWARGEHTEIGRRVLVAGAGPVGREVQAQLERVQLPNLAFAGFLDDDPGKRLQQQSILGTLDETRQVIAANRITDLVIALPQRAHQRIDALVNELIDVPVQIWIVPDYFHLTLHHAVIEDFAGIPMLDLRAAALNDYQRLVKRAFDLFATSLLMIVALPVMGLAALAILLDDGRPVLFRQKRVGENGRLFEIFKFRTMVKNAEALRHLVEKVDDGGNIIHKTRTDPRITRVGRVLRRFSLDELPQLFNILAGSMSLVGPRPELPYLVEKYQPWQRKRFAVPQGLTGWWQIHGRSDKPMHLHTEDDLYYVQNYSIWLDIQILVKTAWIVVRGKGAY